MLPNVSSAVDSFSAYVYVVNKNKQSYDALFGNIFTRDIELATAFTTVQSYLAPDTIPVLALTPLTGDGDDGELVLAKWHILLLEIQVRSMVVLQSCFMKAF